MADKRYRPAIFVSHGGSTMDAVIRATAPGGPLHSLVDPAVIITNNPDAKAVARVHQFNGERRRPVIPVTALNSKICGGEEQLAKDTLETMERFGATGFMLCGYMKKLSQAVIERYYPWGHNQHPAPLSPGKPGFGGRHFYGVTPHQAVLRWTREINRDFQTRAVVHEVLAAEDYDKGAIIHMSAPVAVDIRWTAEELQAQVLPFEHLMVIEALMIIARSYIAGLPRPPVVKAPEIATNLWELRKLEQARMDILEELGIPALIAP